MWGLGWVVAFFAAGAALVAGFEGAEWLAILTGGLAAGIAVLNWRARPVDAVPFLLLYAAVPSMILVTASWDQLAHRPIAAGLALVLCGAAGGLSLRGRAQRAPQPPR